MTRCRGAATAARLTRASGAQGQPVSTTAPVGAQQQAQPASASAPSDTASTVRYGVGLERAIETVRTTVEMAARQGVSQARIQLSPPTLGGIRISLSQTSDGLVARVVAEHGAAAQTLQQGSGELRRSLESAGLPLLRLDIESSDQRGAGAQDPNQAGDGADPTDEANVEEQDGATLNEATAVELSNGAIVNVLA